MGLATGRRAHHYLNSLPNDDRRVEWLALMQHHGGPTRLVDFTKSFYVAAFFALEAAMGDSAIWAANLETIEAHADAALNVRRGPKSTLYDRYQQYVVAAEQFVAEEEGPLYVLPVEPHRLNERLSIQQGMFLMGCDITRTFLENFAGTLGAEFDGPPVEEEVALSDLNITSARQYAFIKIVLPHGIRYEALNDLRTANVTAATLFPGLDGFARSLHIHLHDPLTVSRLRKIFPNGLPRVLP